MQRNTEFVLVAYDITDDKRRTRVSDTLLAFGSTRVNYSVFECLITKANLKKLKKQIEEIINKKEDNVRYYTLCQSCIQDIENHGIPVSSPFDQEEVVII